ncbi:MAG: hypothetical protein AAFZ09_17965, partial [Pseudomonadota bacterium]
HAPASEPKGPFSIDAIMPYLNETELEDRTGATPPGAAVPPTPAPTPSRTATASGECVVQGLST